jgi:uncharacterized membrane protein HdeD (DUF308 family)
MNFSVPLKGKSVHHIGLYAFTARSQGHAPVLHKWVLEMLGMCAFIFNPTDSKYVFLVMLELFFTFISIDLLIVVTEALPCDNFHVSSCAQ